MAAQTGYKASELGEIPLDWEIGTIGKDCVLKARIGWQSLRTDEYLESGEYGLITGTDLNNGLVDWKTCSFVSEWRYKQDMNIQLKVNDVLITKDGTIGKLGYINELPFSATLNSGIYVVRPKNSNLIEPMFLFYLFSSEYFNNFISVISAGSTITHLYQKDFVNFQFPLPSKSEQTAIATALSDTDALIGSLKTLIAKKQAVKLAAMQNLLGGKIRLPAFAQRPDGSPKTTHQTELGCVPEDWEVVELGEICNIKKGELITEGSKQIGDIPVIAGGKKPAYFHNVANRFGKTITISASGANAGFVNFFKIPIFASDCSTISENKIFCIEFMYFYLLNIQAEIYALQTGGAQPHVQPSDLRPLSILIPEKNEQTAIAQLLSDMDAEIESLECRLKKTQALKQGMMQALLTGKIRLPLE